MPGRNNHAGCVAVYEEHVRLTTYSVGADDPYPPVLQEGYRTIYPYSWQRAFTETPTSEAYRVIKLQNEYLDARVVPDLGGRLLRVLDRQTGDDLFFFNPIVRPASIGLRGAWYAGGVEFNFPNSHHVATHEPVPCTYHVLDDGEVGEVVIGDLDRVSGCRWTVTIRLRSGSAALEIIPFLENPTDHAHPVWYWTNAAVGPHEKGRFLFPTHNMVKEHLGRYVKSSELVSFPRHEGHDWRHYRNYSEPTSLFAVDPGESFFAYANGENDTTLVRHAPFWDAPGRKLWHWGYGDDGAVSSEALTESDAPYAEIQSGRPSSQLHYDVLAPHTTLTWTERWWPARALPRIDSVSAELAVGMGTECLHVASHERLQGLHLFVSGERVASFDLKPGKGASLPLRLSARPESPYHLAITQGDARIWEGWLHEGKGERALRSSPATHSKRDTYLAELELPDSRPMHSRTLQQLVNAGDRALRGRRNRDARGFFREALALDPESPIARRRLGDDCLRRGLWQEAEAHFMAILALDKNDHDALIGLALAWEAGGDLAAAEKGFAAAAGRLAAGRERALLPLARVRARQGRMVDALAAAEAAAVDAGRNVHAWETVAVLARRLGNVRLADCALEFLRKHHLGLISHLEQVGEDERCKLPSWLEALPGEKRNVLIQRAVNTYAALGLYTDALDAAALVSNDAPGGLLLEYIKAYLAGCAGKQIEAGPPPGSPPPYEFPSTTLERDALAHALERNPDDAVAASLLGLYHVHMERFDEALTYLERARAHGAPSALTQRHLGLVYIHTGRRDDALSAFLAAAELDPAAGALIAEGSRLAGELGNQAARRRLWAMAVPPAFEHPEGAAEWAAFLIDEGRGQDAAAFLASRRFYPFEASRLYRDLWIESWLSQWADALVDGDASGAATAAGRALEYRRNLGVGQGVYTDDALQRWALAESHATVDPGRAAALWREAAEEPFREWTEATYYQALALRRLGRDGEATRLLERLRDGAHALASLGNDFAAVSAFLEGLALKGLGSETWRTKLEEALGDSCCSRAAKRYLRGAGWDEVPILARAKEADKVG